MGHDALDGPVDLRLGRQDVAEVGGHDLAGRQLGEELAQHLVRLLHLLDADEEAVEVVAVGPHRDVEVEPVVDQVGRGLAEVPGLAGGAQAGAAEAEVEGVLPAHRGHPAAAVDEDAVAGEERLDLVAQQHHPVQGGQGLLGPALGQVAAHPADAHVVGGDPGAAQLGEPVVDVVAGLDGVEEGRHGPQLHGHGAHHGEVVADAVHLARHGAQVEGPLRHLEPAQLLHRHGEAHVVEDRAHVVEPVGVREALGPGHVLAALLEAAVQEPDVDLAGDQPLAVQLDHGARRPVHGRVRRPHVDEHPLGLERCVEGAWRRGADPRPLDLGRHGASRGAASGPRGARGRCAASRGRPGRDRGTAPRSPAPRPGAGGRGSGSPCGAGGRRTRRT